MLRTRTARMLDDAAFMIANGSKQVQPLSGFKRLSFGYLALAVLLSKEDVSTSIGQLVSTDQKSRSYLFDLLVRAFVPQHPVEKKYKADKFVSPWLDPVVRALARPPQQRAAALGQHMQNWTRLMRGLGWKPNLNTEPGNDKLFCDFAFEVALAVCAYDIDDSAFSDHPYYPADLVRHYRAHVRGTRDAWRAEGVGAGVAITAPAPPPKADLAKSKRKSLARWIELVADGDNDATEAVLEATGKVRKVKDLDELLCALSDNNLAVHADIKDDQTLEIQASDLGEARGLGPFDGPSTPPQGPARCEAILHAWRDWTAARGYVQVGIDLQDDAWHAVLVRQAFHDELLQLSSELAIPPLPAH
nr:PoNe immunity protein domain-containing protein [uncultured Duganella sp.]